MNRAIIQPVNPHLLSVPTAVNERRAQYRIRYG